MEPRGGAAKALSEVTPQPPLARIRLAAGALLLTGLAFVQSPGDLVADSKVDLAVDPGGFLARAAHLWDGGAAFGQLQNQAYGYGWPMGPFFWLGDALDLDGWVVQRLWLALVLATAFVGAAMVTRALGVRTELACLVAGAAYATSPRLISIVGGVSIEAWPSALAPWVLLPLVLGAERGSPRRAAALSALAIGMVGGVNAAATAAVLPLGVVWLLSRTAGPRRRQLLLWWPIFTLLATAWWLVPLFVLGAYSPPFLDWIESASVTTFPTTPFDVLRGTSAWIPYVDSDWGAGNDLLRQFHLVLNSTVLLVLGAIGVTARRTPHRVFLICAAATGILLVSLGHQGAVAGWFAGPEQAALDGWLSPLRNVHKMDAVIRLPLVVGLAWWLDSLVRSPRRAPVAAARHSRLDVTSHPRDPVRATGIFVAILAVTVTASPLLAGRVAPAGAASAVPDYWVETADWLSDHSDQGTALLVPGSPFGTYAWGETRDEPMQWLSSSSWAVRNAVPLAPAGNIRMLDAVEERLGQGHGSSGLSSYLLRAGVTHLVMRNDLSRSADVPDPALVHQAIESSPGLVLTAQFGPVLGGPSLSTVQGRRVLVNGGWESRRAAVEIYAVRGPSDRDAGQIATTSRPATVVGGPEDLVDLADLGLLDDGPTVLGVDADEDAPLPGPLVLTDGLRARERNFGRVHDGASEVLTPGAPRRTGNPVADYVVGEPRWWTTAEQVGVSVTATSSQADADNPGGAVPGFLAWAAVDTDPESTYRSQADDARATLGIELDEPLQVDRIEVLAGPDATSDQRIQVLADGETVALVVLLPGERVSVAMPDDQISEIALMRAGGESAVLDIAEVQVPGVSGSRWLRLPDVPTEWGPPDVVVLRSLLDHRTGCVVVAGVTRCAPEQSATPSEEPGTLQRVVVLPEDRAYQPRILVRPAPDAASSLAQKGQFVSVVASSEGYPDPLASAVAAVDRRGRTTWLARPDDDEPSLEVSLLRERTISAIRMRTDPSAPARAPVEVRVTWKDGSEVLRLDREGRAELRRPVRATRLELTVVKADTAISLGYDQQVRDLPVGVTELRLRGAPELPLRLGDVSQSYGCGSGPTLSVDDIAVTTRVLTSPQAILQGSTILAEPCTEAPVRLLRGENRIALSGDRPFLPTAVVFGDLPEADTGTATVTTAGPVERQIEDTAAGVLVSLVENANPGWRADQGGTQLEPLVVDGWRQGWWSRSDSSVRARFTPDTTYRIGLLAGAVMAVLLLALLVRSRRWAATADPLVSSSLPQHSAIIGAVVVAGLVAGWPAALGVAVLAWPAIRDHRVPTSASAGLIATAGLGYAWRPWGSDVGWAGSWTWPGVLVAVAVGLLVVSAGLPRRRFFKHMAGSSTPR